MRKALAVLTILAVAALAAFAYAPRPKSTASVSLAANAAGDTLTGKWVYRAPLPATDTAIAAWSQKTATATSFTQFTASRTRGTSSTVYRALPPDGSYDTIQVCVRVKRVGASQDSPTTCAKRGRLGNVLPPDPVDSLDLSLVLDSLTPHPVAVVTGQAIQFTAWGS